MLINALCVSLMIAMKNAKHFSLSGSKVGLRLSLNGFFLFVLGSSMLNSFMLNLTRKNTLEVSLKKEYAIKYMCRRPKVLLSYKKQFTFYTFISQKVMRLFLRKPTKFYNIFF